jgi:hypothetical protein
VFPRTIRWYRLRASPIPPQCPEFCGNPRLLCRGTRSSNPYPSSGESGANSTPRFGDQCRVSSVSRQVPISYFFADLQSDDAELSVEDTTWREQLQWPETIELIRLYYAISNPEIRRQFLKMTKSVAEASAPL